MGKIIYTTGGARSGKSLFAEKYVYSLEKNRIYLATMNFFDEATNKRIEHHKKQRGENWTTIEAYKNLPQLLEEYKEKEYVILLDCITNLVTNRMFDHSHDWENISIDYVQEIENTIKNEIIEFLAFLRQSKIDCVLVSNEVGMGLVPDNQLGRYFIDICGRVNQIIAKEADEAYFLVSGLAMSLK